MKLNPHARLTRSFRSILIAASALLGAGSMQAANFFDDPITVGGNTINLGNASGGSSTVVSTHKNWAIFALSGGVTITDPTNTGPSAGGGFIASSYDVLGNVGMAGGVLTMTNSWIKGSAYTNTGATITGNPNITNTGTAGPTVNAAYLSSAVTSANNSSTQAGLMGTLTTGLSYTYNGGAAAIPTTFALNGSAGPATATFSGGAAGQTYVLNLTDLVLSGVGAVLTLNGTATTNYVINVNRYMSMSANSQITLSGGMTPSNVLFNVKNNFTYDVTLSGGASAKGIILAPNRNVKLTGGAVVNGEVIAKGVSLSGRSKVLNPFVSP